MAVHRALWRDLVIWCFGCASFDVAKSVVSGVLFEKQKKQPASLPKNLRVDELVPKRTAVDFLPRQSRL